MAEKKMPERVQLVYKDAVDNLMFFKRQQWFVTTYALTAYAALVAVAGLISGDQRQLPLWATLLFSVTIVLVAYYSWRVLSEFKEGIDKFRERVRWVYQDSNYFTKNEISGLKLGEPKGEFYIICRLKSVTYWGAAIAIVAVFSM